MRPVDTDEKDAAIDELEEERQSVEEELGGLEEREVEVDRFEADPADLEDEIEAI